MINLEKKYTDEYLSYIQRLNGDEEGRRLAWTSMANGPSTWQGDTTQFTYVPKLIDWKTKEKFICIAETTHAILSKSIKRYLSNENFRHEFELDKRVENLILNSANNLRDEDEFLIFPYGRVDFVYNEDTGEYKAIEFNTDASGGMLENIESFYAISKTKPYKKFESNHTLSTDVSNLTDKLTDSFVRAFNKSLNIESEQHRDNPHLAIVVLFESENPDLGELITYQKLFEKRGYSCSIVDVRDIKFDGQKAIATKSFAGPSNIPITAIWRFCIVSDLLRFWDSAQDFINAAKSNIIPMIGGFHTQIAHDKQLFAILDKQARLIKNGQCEKWLSDEEVSFIRDCIPSTFFLKDADANTLNKIYNNKNLWVIKPTDGYESKGVIAGRDVGEQEWKSKIEAYLNKSKNNEVNYLVQEFCPPYKTDNISVLGANNTFNLPSTKLGNIIGLYVHFGKFGGAYVRQGKSAVIGSFVDGLVSPVVYVNDIEQLLKAGDMRAIRNITNSPYKLKGTIIHGKGHGHKHGMPTANLKIHNENLLPKNGVYASKMLIDGKCYYGVTNIGLRPTDDDNSKITIETILHNFNSDIYGKNVELEIWKFLRDTIKFSGGLDELREQIGIDIKDAVEYLMTTE